MSNLLKKFSDFEDSTKITEQIIEMSRNEFIKYHGIKLTNVTEWYKITI